MRATTMGATRRGLRGDATRYAMRASERERERERREIAAGRVIYIYVRPTRSRVRAAARV
jgi:hypothetical protein